MNYLKNEISLLQEIKNRLREDIAEALGNLLDGYNKVYITAVNQQKYVKKTREEHAETMDQNFKLLERNKFLEKENKHYKNENKSKLEYIKQLEKEVRDYKKLLNKTQTKEEV